MRDRSGAGGHAQAALPAQVGPSARTPPPPPPPNVAPALLEAQGGPVVSVNVNFARGDGCRKSGLLILISRHAGQELQLSLKRSLVISEFGPWGKEEEATERTWLHPPRPSALASRTYCNC